MRRRRVAALLSAGLLGLVLAWLAGFAWFVRGAIQAPAPVPAADGIVVLTGGADRIVTGVRLLQLGRGRVLLISGVGHGADLAALLRGTGIDPAPLLGRVTLGRLATTTIGNADETAVWVRAQGVRSLLVVTASYHMPRALTELARSVPGVALVPVAVVPPALHHADLSTMRLLAGEYTKWLAAELWLGRLASDGGRA